MSPVPWKYIRFFKAPHPYESSDIEKQGAEPVLELLFSLEDDPEERDNRIDDPELRTKAAELRRGCDSDLNRLLRLRKKYASRYLK